MQTRRATRTGTHPKRQLGTARPKAVANLDSVGFTKGNDDDVRSGLLGFITLGIGGMWLVDGVTLRRTEHGKLSLSFPCRKDSSGRRHPLIRPLDATARRAIENAVFAALGVNEEAGL